jgi:hypothetical protein
MTPGLLHEIVDALTDHPRQVEPSPRASTSSDAHRAGTSIEQLLRQAPMPAVQRRELLERLRAAMPTLIADHGDEVVETAAALHDAVLRIPISTSEPVALPALDATLAAAYQTLIGLDAAVSEPWTLIGGLMVMTHCLERGAPFNRPTGDADIAVSVFTHRRALARVTGHLRDAQFVDVSPPALPGDDQLSYRWAREGVKLDVAVPPKANDQRDPPTTVTGRTAVELPATQQALRRTERLRSTADGIRGFVRRPDLLGAIVIKSAAAAADRRDPDRHREDLVTLADIMAFDGDQTEYAPQTTEKDRARIRTAMHDISMRQWRAARDPDAARRALEYLVGN